MSTMRTIIVPLLTACVGLYTQAAPIFAAERGPVAHYTFDEGSGAKLLDHSGHGNHGDIHGAVWVPGRIGGGLSFTSGSYVDCGRVPASRLTDDFAVLAWVKFSPPSFPNPDTNWTIVDCEKIDESGFILRVDGANGRLYFRTSANGNYTHGSSPTTLKHDVFQQVGVVKNGRTATLYIDGEPCSRFEVSNPGPTSSAFTISLGRPDTWNESPQSFHGIIDEVMIYDRGISEDEVYDHYLAGASDQPKRIKGSSILRYSKGRVDLTIDYRMLRPLSAGSSLSLAVRGQVDGNTLIRKTVSELSPSGMTKLSVDAQSLDAGDYEVDATVHSPGGILFEQKAAVTFAWPEKPVWLGSKEGISNSVLAPWTPLSVEQQDGLRIGMWGRTYEFGGDLLLSQVNTIGTPILAAPMNLIADVDGKRISWTGQKTNVTENTPALVRFSQTAESSDGNLKLRAGSQVEYDGMLRIDLDVTAQKRATLGSLTLDVPMSPEVARYYYYYMDWQRDRNHRPGLIPDGGVRLDFRPVMWLGDEEKGLEWFCESDENWFNADPQRSIEIVRDGNAVVLRLRLVDHPVQVSPEKGLNYTFGIQATPVKPIEKDGWDYRIIGGPYGKDYSLLTTQLGGKPAIQYMADSGVRTLMLGNWTKIICYNKPIGHEEELRALVKACHDTGIKVIVYFGTTVSELAPEARFFHQECERGPSIPGTDNYPNETPQVTYQICGGSVWQDFVVDGIARLIDEYDIDGVYFDGTAVPVMCNNTLHGCGYTRPDGSVAQTCPIFATRDFMRRVYTAVKSRKPDGLVDMHIFGMPITPSIAWGTSYWDGETLNTQYQPFAPDSASLDYFPAQLMGKSLGIPADFLHYRALGGQEYEKGFALSLLHDMLVRYQVTESIVSLASGIWNFMDEFGRKEAEWLPYWKNAEYVSVGPEGIHASLYKHPRNGVVVVVSNISGSRQEAAVRLSPESLGLIGSISAMDGLTRESVPLSDGGLRLPLDHLEWKLIWLRAGE